MRSAGQGGAPLARAKVVISDRSGRVVASAVTSGDGGFTVAGAPAGSYAVTATASGHLPARRDIELNGHPQPRS
ncbi:MAG TPA: carboxypeptidase-like regulatory domain-containing protein [Streptosporangiaceae bacterium]